jgi:uncharacterized membrane protein (DUF373 family)
VAAVLLVAGLYTVGSAALSMVLIVSSGAPSDAVFAVAENALLALILAELVRTIVATLGGKPLNLEPFLIIAGVAVVRKLVFSAALATKGSAGAELITPEIVELMVLGALLLTLGAFLSIVSKRRQPG